MTRGDRQPTSPASCRPSTSASIATANTTKPAVSNRSPRLDASSRSDKIKRLAGPTKENAPLTKNSQRQDSASASPPAINGPLAAKARNPPVNNPMPTACRSRPRDILTSEVLVTQTIAEATPWSALSGIMAAGSDIRPINRVLPANGSDPAIAIRRCRTRSASRPMAMTGGAKARSWALRIHSSVDDETPRSTSIGGRTTGVPAKSSWMPAISRIALPQYRANAMIPAANATILAA